MSNIIEAMKSNPEAIGVFKLDDLRIWADEIRRDAMADYKQQQAEKAAIASTLPELFTTEEAMRYLNKSRSTINRWAECGYLQKQKIYGSVFYRREDILKVMESEGREH